MTIAPLVVKDKALAANSGGEMGVRGWLKALDVETGEIAWRTYSTGTIERLITACTEWSRQLPLLSV
jgi:alcohol dehydrogenase (cytochrome c)